MAAACRWDPRQALGNRAGVTGVAICAIWDGSQLCAARERRRVLVTCGQGAKPAELGWQVVVIEGRGGP